MLDSKLLKFALSYDAVYSIRHSDALDLSSNGNLKHVCNVYVCLCALLFNWLFDQFSELEGHTSEH